MGKTRNTGFSNNAIQFNSGSISFTSGSTTRMFISASGNVGIGTTTPSYKLDTSGSARIGAGVTQVAPSSTDILSTAHVILGGQGDNYLTIGQYPASQSFAAWIQSSYLNPTTAKYNLILNPLGGNIGIGTATPTTKLEIADANGIPLRIGDVSTSPINQTAGYIGLSTSAYSGINGDLVLIPRANASARILLLSGSVGIGTTSTSTEANLFLGNNGLAEGGQLVLQKGTSYASASHIDNYQDQLRIMSGTDVGSSTVRMTINMATGNVGIAGTAGSGRLQVWGEDQSGSNFSLTTYNSGGFGMFFVRNDGNIRTNSGMYGNTTSGTTRSVFVGNGDYYLGGISSTRASKKNIENIPNIDWIYQLNPVTFNYRKKDEEGNYTEETYEELNYGLIAEDTSPIADFLINYNDKEDGTKEMIGIEYMRLITPMLKAIQELKAENDALKTRIETLENK